MTSLIQIGSDIQTGNNIAVSTAARRLSTYIIGKPGTGKSALLENIAYQDMLNGEGFIFIDPHEVSAEQLLHLVPSTRTDDVVFWDPTDKARPFVINPFFCADPDEIDSASSNFLAVLASLAEFAEIFKSAPVMKSILKYVAVTFMVNQGYTLAETPEFLTNPSYRQQFYPALSAEYSQVRATWERFDRRPMREQRELVASSLNKVERFQIDRTMRTIFGQPTNSIDFRQAMDTGKIIIVKLSGSRIGPDNAAFIGAFIIWNVFQAALSRSDTPVDRLRPFHLIADEFQTYMSTAFPRLIEECRKFWVDVTVAHQTRIQLDERSRAATLAVGNKVVFGVSARDAGELAREFDTTPPPAESVPEQMMEPVYETYIDEQMSSPELELAIEQKELAEQGLHLLRVHEARVIFERELMDTVFVVPTMKKDKAPRLEILEPGYKPYSTDMMPEIFRDIQAGILSRAQYDDPDLLPDKYRTCPRQFQYAAIYRSLNPNHFNKDVAAYARQCVDVYRQRGKSDTHKRFSTRFPSHLMTPAEERLQKLATQEEYYFFRQRPSNDECRGIVQRLESEFLALFVPLKKRAVYWWDFSHYDAVYEWRKEAYDSYTRNDIWQWRGGPLGGHEWELTEFPEVLSWLQEKWNTVRERERVLQAHIRFTEDNRKTLSELITKLKMKQRITHYRPIREVRDKGLSRGEVSTRDAISAYRLKEGSRRSFDDVANEIANVLTNLPARVARCKLTQDLAPVEYTIRTIAPPKMPPDGAERAQMIRERSRDKFGHDRAAVEALITQRLQTNATVGGSVTMENDGDDLPTDQPAPILSDIFESPDI